MLTICISFDYELFLGKNYESHDEILFNPSAKLSRMLKRNGVGGTFFADVCSVFAHEKFGITEYVEKFSNQLMEFIEDNNDVQLHVHTNWLKSDLSKGFIGAEGYRIHEFGFSSDPSEQESGYWIIRRGKEYLEKICRQSDPDYQCIAYRAGGFCTQPENELIQALHANGIWIDSSVTPHLCSLSTVNCFDYRHTPRKFAWWVSDDFTKEAAVHERTVFEIPVQTTRPNILRLLKCGANQIKLPPHPSKGMYAEGASKVSKNALIDKIGKVMNRFIGARTLSFDSQHSTFLINEVEHIYRQCERSGEDGIISLICHPKLAHDDRIENMERFIQGVNRHNGAVRFATFSDIANEIGGK